VDTIEIMKNREVNAKLAVKTILFEIVIYLLYGPVKE